ncbi:LacI family DNA-binding transcriptional regulator [Agrobacterium sp. BA1120]|uniref:LacI family DNA-binding transcriptional regulator n=1 Tax=Agrobacterium sp. BA1120 TaxID=3228927 RepID=UPI003369D5E9
MSYRSKRGASGKVTLQDVAKETGVSAITVSRALREPGKVSNALRDQILNAIENMGYVPDLNARALASGTSAFIGVLLPSLSHPALSAVLSGIEARVRGTDYRIQYSNTHYDPEEEVKQLRAFAAQRPAGVIVAGTERLENLKTIVKEAGCPVVQTIDSSLKMEGIAVGIDHKQAAMAATRHMLSQGYRRFGILGCGHDIRVRLRKSGYCEVMQQAGLFDESLIIWQDAPPSIHLGSRMIRRFIESRPDVDGVLCQSDDLALGVIFESQRLGMRVPEDFGICGYNDLDYAVSTEPPLTTVRVPRFDIGYKAADIVITLGQGGLIKERIFNMGFEMVDRQTTRRLKAAASA